MVLKELQGKDEMERFFSWRKRVKGTSLRSDFLFPIPSAVSGVARILDIGCTYTSLNRSETPEEADYKSVFSDWTIVGQDLTRAARNFDGK